jgi:hypothetical protein
VAAFKWLEFLPDATRVGMRRREGLGSTRRLFGALIIPLVILAMIGSLLLFEMRAESVRTRTARIVDAEVRINHLHATLLEHLARGTLPDEATIEADLATQEAAATASIESLDMGSLTKDFTEYTNVASLVWEVRSISDPAEAIPAGAEEAIAIGAFRLSQAFDAVQRDLTIGRR